MGVVATKSFSFALEIIKLYKFLSGAKKEYVLSKQVLRSGTAVGALIREAEHAQLKADFLHKMYIALKEANETEYWLMLLKAGEYIDTDRYRLLMASCKSILRLLISIVNTTKISLNR
ncbi:MAG: four helix bundle protein [Bacteroidota bacterium]